MMELIVKAFHVVAVISWMAGLLYLPRLFVYHAGVPVGSETAKLLGVMEARLYRFIMRPALIAVWLSGLWLAWQSFAFRGGWLHVKLLLVLVMTAHHGLQGRWLRAFAEGKMDKSSRFFRIQNEVPTLLMIGIVILVIIKPF